jgi:aldose 1-epimerase
MALKIVQLRDATSGSTAKVLADYGFNCYQLRLVDRGEPVEVLWSAAGFENGTERASHSGIPILFPFPGRISGTSFHFRGRDYPLSAGDGIGNAIHGFVLNRPWQIMEQSDNRVVGRFHAAQVDVSLLEHWPADFELTVSYELKGTSLVSEIEAVNPDNKSLPIGLGTHPYFRVPLGARGTAAECRVTVPAEEYWQLEGMIATGRRLPVDASKDLRGGMSFSQTKFDDVFGGLRYERGMCRTSIDDPGNGRRLAMTFGEEFHACVVYNPPHREAICIEPYSAVPDAFRLEAAGVETGAVVLEPGQRWRTKIEIALEAAP